MESFSRNNLSNGKYGSFTANRAGAYSYGLMSVGKTFSAKMVFSDGSSSEWVSGGTGAFDYNSNGWRSISNSAVKQTFTFDFSGEIIGKKQVGTTTNYIIFDTSGAGGAFSLLVVNGLVCYKN